MPVSNNLGWGSKWCLCTTYRTYKNGLFAKAHTMKNKTERIQLRVSLDDKNSIEKMARGKKTTVSHLMVHSVLNKPIYIKWQPDIHAEELKKELSTIGRNLFQLVKLRRVFKFPETMALQNNIDEIEKMMKKINHYYDSKSNH